MTDTTLAQRLEKIADASRRDDGTDIPLGQELREAAEEITGLRDANKALTAKAGFLHDYANMRDVQVVDLVARAEAAEAKLAKVEAERDEKIARALAKADYEAERAGNIENENDRLSAKLAEARQQLERAWEDLQAIDTHIDQRTFGRARGIVSQVAFRIRSYLASSKEDARDA